MTDIVEKIVFKQVSNLAKAIDNYSMKLLNVPDWIANRL